MRIPSLFVVAVIAFVAALAVAGCKDSGSSTPTCDEAMSNVYDQNCVLYANGYAITKTEAINGCEDQENDAENCGCSDKRDDLLSCLADMQNCNDCDTEFSKLNDCLATC